MRAAILAICLVCAAPAAAAAPLDQSFFGVQGWDHPERDELRSLERGGLGSLRAGFNRATVLDRDGDAHWGELDALVGDAATSGIEVLPVLAAAPYVKGKHRARPPRTPSARRKWARWVEQVVDRYGRGGDFWLTHRDLPYFPITAWQVWNEPNLKAHWPRPNARSYVALLRATSAAIRDTDLDATVVLAGVPDTRRGIRLRPYLRALYRRPGFKRLFDVVALHPYAQDVSGVEEGIELARRVMRRSGDARRPIWVTEIGWATSGPFRSAFRVSVRAQAERLRDAYDMFIEERERWRLQRVFWFSLRDRDLADGEPDWFGPHTGLFYRSGYAKPAWEELADVTGGVADDWLGRAFELPLKEDEQPCELQLFCG
jgi:Glycosyl hydrolase catalytic core